MSALNNTNVTSSLQNCLRHSLRVLVCFLFVFLIANATPHFLDDGDLADSLKELGAIRLPEKRPARLSYFRAPYKSSRRRYGGYGGSRSYGYGYGRRRYGSVRKNDWWRKKAVNRNMMPWDSLPNTMCFRKYCSDDRDCCRRFSKCNKQAHVCYDCWYGHPCRNHRDCCSQYPYCNPALKTCTL